MQYNWLPMGQRAGLLMLMRSMAALSHHSSGADANSTRAIQYAETGLSALKAESSALPPARLSGRVRIRGPASARFAGATFAGRVHGGHRPRRRACSFARDRAAPPTALQRSGKKLWSCCHLDSRCRCQLSDTRYNWAASLARTGSFWALVLLCPNRGCCLSWFCWCAKHARVRADTPSGPVSMPWCSCVPGGKRRDTQRPASRQRATQASSERRELSLRCSGVPLTIPVPSMLSCGVCCDMWEQQAGDMISRDHGAVCRGWRGAVLV